MQSGRCVLPWWRLRCTECVSGAQRSHSPESVSFGGSQVPAVLGQKMSCQSSSDFRARIFATERSTTSSRIDTQQ